MRRKGLLAASSMFVALAALAGQGDKNLERDLIRLSDRPANYETPEDVFNEFYTPNSKFFVRYHLANIPRIEAKDWKLTISGEGIEKPLTLTLDQLRRDFEQVEVPAVTLCAGNRRAFFEPRVPGVQWKKGGMGNARWRGVRLRDVLAKAGLKKDAVEIVLDGADTPVIGKTPDFIKSLPVAKAMEESTLIAYEMNGEPLPQSQGFPARVVVPGWVATYWIKHIVSIEAINKPYDGFWVKTAYRMPKGKASAVEKCFPTQEADASVAVAEMVVNSMFTGLADGQKVKAGQELLLHGFAWDGGHGIQKVQVSTDGGKTWTDAILGEDAGRFSWRRFSLAFRPDQKQTYLVMARATNGAGQTQPVEVVHNPSGYHHNAVQAIRVTAN